MAEPDYSNAGVAAAAAGMPVIDPTQHKVKYGGDEINVTRDLIAKRSQYGTTVPGTSGRTNGEIFFKI
jgi:hypothetical protein